MTARRIPWKREERLHRAGQTRPPVPVGGDCPLEHGQMGNPWLLDLPTRARYSLAFHEAQDALKWFDLFNWDVEGATLSFRLYDELKSVIDPANNRAIMYHASCFVCAVRRAGSLLESLQKYKDCFRDPVAAVIKIEWNKKNTFFESFRIPRNAIEHTDKIGRGKWSLFNLHYDLFCVVDGVSVKINRTSLNKLCSARDAIAEAIIKEYRHPSLEFLDRAAIDNWA
jgi:hypothetical protein